jgi:alpha-1,3-rhamnosyl/mannosyltransferase
VTERVVRDAALILTVSEWSKRDLCERFCCEPEKVRLSLNGLHPDFLAGAPPGAGDAARARRADGRPYVFSPGALLERKNTGRLLDAWGLLQSRRRDLPHLLLVSGVAGHADRFRERAARAGCGDTVRFLPYVDRSELVGLYAGADLCVYPSLVEGWGIPVLEALAVGTPVATSNTSAMPEAGGEHARYFDPESAEAIAEAVEQEIDHRADFDAVRAAAVARARTFTWRRTAEGVLAAYREVAR